MTDSVLDGLFAQLKGEFDRTLLLVIADRYDELEAGAGEGWRAMHANELEPEEYWESEGFYLWTPPQLGFRRKSSLPVTWGNLVVKMAYYTNGHHLFQSLAVAYMAAAEAWMEMTKFQRLRALEELK